MMMIYVNKCFVNFFAGSFAQEGVGPEESRCRFFHQRKLTSCKALSNSLPVFDDFKGATNMVMVGSNEKFFFFFHFVEKNFVEKFFRQNFLFQLELLIKTIAQQKKPFALRPFAKNAYNFQERNAEPLASERRLCSLLKLVKAGGGWQQQ